MSHEFRLKYNQLKENDPTQKEQEENYPTGSAVRNVCFVQLDGSRIFLNYGYLVSGEFSPFDTKITLSFTSHIIILEGIKLEILFNDLMNHIPQCIVCQDVRYNAFENGKSIVNTMTILKAE